MTTAVLDASALLAFLLNEPGGDAVGEALESGAACSTVNLSEVAQKLRVAGGDWRIADAILEGMGLVVESATIVDAVKAADLVNVLSNAGPFTVFAPTNAAFDKLPPGTVEDLLKPEKKEALADILQYHVAVAVYKTEMLQDGQVIPMANDGKVTIGVKDGKVTVNGANIVASVPASNGIVHVIDAVLLQK